TRSSLVHKVCVLALDGHHPGPSPGSPQRAGRRLPNSQAGVEQQRPESAHSIAASQSREHRLLLHQPGQPRAGALANLGGRVLELRDRSKVSGDAVRTRPGLGAGARSAPAQYPLPGSGGVLASLTFSSSSAAGPSSSSSPFSAAAASA
uniref:Uncharacterized protein n=1 Tax=Urocitellus parryii TaxID=9999 RepID=A0A8D2HUP8_UROPR